MLSLSKHLAEGAFSVWATRPGKWEKGFRLRRPNLAVVAVGRRGLGFDSEWAGGRADAATREDYGKRPFGRVRSKSEDSNTEKH